MIHLTNCYTWLPNICTNLGTRKTKMTKVWFLTSKSVQTNGLADIQIDNFQLSGTSNRDLDLGMTRYEQTRWEKKSSQPDMESLTVIYGRRFGTLYRRQWSKPSPRKINPKRQNGDLRKTYKYLRKEDNGKEKEKRKVVLIQMQNSKE